MGLVIWGALLFVGGAVAAFSPLMLIAVFTASIELALEGESGDVGSIILIFGMLAMTAGLPMMLMGTARLIEVPSPTDVSTDTIANAITDAMSPAVVAIRDMTVAQNPEPIEEPEPVWDERVMAVARRRLLAELSNGEE